MASILNSRTYYIPKEHLSIQRKLHQMNLVITEENYKDPCFFIKI